MFDFMRSVLPFMTALPSTCCGTEMILYILVVPPMITMPDPGQRLVVNETNSAIFDCSATGIPTPLIQWYRGDLLLNETGPGVNARVNMMNSVDISLGELGTAVSTLTIARTIGSDSGNYTCVASNEIINNTETVEERRDVSIELFVQGNFDGTACMEILHNCFCGSVLVVTYILLLCTHSFPS